MPRPPKLKSANATPWRGKGKSLPPIGLDYVAPPDAPISRQLTVYTLGNFDCHYPHDHPRSAGFGYCGCAVITRVNAQGITEPASAYCPYHHKLVHQPPRTSARLNQRSASLAKFAAS